MDLKHKAMQFAGPNIPRRVRTLHGTPDILELQGALWYRAVLGWRVDSGCRQRLIQLHPWSSGGPEF